MRLNDIKSLKPCYELGQPLREHGYCIKRSPSFEPLFSLTMAYQSFTETLDRRSDGFIIPIPTGQPLAYVVVAFLFLLAFYSTGQKKADIPELNPPKSRLRLPGVVSTEQAQSFIRHSQELFKAGRAKFPDQPYRLYSYLGDSVIIPPKLINDIRNEEALDFQISAQYASSPSRISKSEDTKS